MKGKRLVDVLGEEWMKENGWVYDKFVKLYKLIESTNPDMDDEALRWVENKIEKMEDGIVMGRENLEQANAIYRRFNK